MVPLEADVVFLDLTGIKPLYQQIYAGLRAQILSGKLQPGAKLPSTRALSQELRVSRNVVLLAYENLSLEGYVVSKRGSGIYVNSIPDSYFVSKVEGQRGIAAEQKKPRLSDHVLRLSQATTRSFDLGSQPSRSRYDFRYGHPAMDLFPRSVWRAVAERQLAAYSRSEMGYGNPAGYGPLLDATSDYLARNRGVVCDAATMLIINGIQQAIGLAVRLLVNPGDLVVVEEPCFPGVRQVLTGYGARIQGIEVDDEGLVTQQLSAITEPVRLIFITPSHQFPTGAVMSRRRRSEVIAFARKTGAYIFEDDYDSEFRYDTRPECSVQGLDPSGPIIYAGSFSKVLFPALRVGYLVVPPELRSHLILLKSLSDRHTATFSQIALAEFVRGGHFERHLRKARPLLAERRQQLIASLVDAFGEKIELIGKDAGGHLLIWLNGVPRDAIPAITQRASAMDVTVYPVDGCYIAPPERVGFVMGFASLTPSAIREGVRRFHRSVVMALCDA